MLHWQLQLFQIGELESVSTPVQLQSVNFDGLQIETGVTNLLRFPDSRPEFPQLIFLPVPSKQSEPAIQSSQMRDSMTSQIFKKARKKFLKVPQW